MTQEEKGLSRPLPVKHIMDGEDRSRLRRAANDKALLQFENYRLRNIIIRHDQAKVANAFTLCAAYLKEHKPALSVFAAMCDSMANQCKNEEACNRRTEEDLMILSVAATSGLSAETEKSTNTT